VNDQDRATFEELDQVEVVRLHYSIREVDGTERVCRQPRIGDRGTVVSLLQRGSGTPSYYVECVDEAGLTVWLAEFDGDELAPLPERAA